jgi:murein DD-endopeptidase MepM/ murein hydrolase activator NlpD
MRMRRKSILALLCAVAILAPAGLSAGAQESGSQERLERIEARIERTRRLIRDANEERQGLLVGLARSDERRKGLSERIDDLAAELADAEGRLAVLQASLTRTEEELDRWSRRLNRTRSRLSDQRDTLGERAATAYKLGPAGFLDLLLQAEDLRALTDRVEFVSSVLDADSILLTSIRTTRARVGEHRGRISEYQELLALERDRVQREVDRIAQLKAEQEALRAEVDQEIAHREDLLADVEASKAAYVQAVKELEAESARIQAMIQASGSSGSGSPSTGSGNASAQLHWPATGSITSGFGWRTHPIFGTQRFHAGVDINSPCGAPIFAAERGSVITSGWSGGYGQVIVVDHGDGLSTLYAHQSVLGASTGQQVSPGQRIGTVGTTGWSTGCHLHFEVRVNGSPVDPVPYLT